MSAANQALDVLVVAFAVAFVEFGINTEVDEDDNLAVAFDGVEGTWMVSVVGTKTGHAKQVAVPQGHPLVELLRSLATARSALSSNARTTRASSARASSARASSARASSARASSARASSARASST